MYIKLWRILTAGWESCGELGGLGQGHRGKNRGDELQHSDKTKKKSVLLICICKIISFHISNMDSLIEGSMATRTTYLGYSLLW